MKNSTPPLEARHQPSGLNSRFDGSQLTFANYVTHSRDMLGKVRSGSGTANTEKIVDGNAPFELKPTSGDSAGKQKTWRRGVLLTHGLTDSPYFMRHLAGFFRENGFRVMAILLPGHGTQPGDLLDVAWPEWAKAVAYGADRLAEEVDEVYLAGFSTGGTLSIYQSLRDDRVRGLFLFSPALEITRRAAWANMHRLYSWLMPPAKWVGIRPDRSFYKYESLPKNAVAQTHALTKKLDSMLQEHEVIIPVFAAASQDDTTANTPATLEFMAHARHPSSRLVLYTTDTGKFLPGIPAEKLELVDSVMPGQKILSSAHTAIVLPSDDPHYGTAGDYSNCIHYYPDDMEKYEACINNSGDVLQGEITEANLRTGTLRRLMYNPNFAALKVSMKRFIDNLP
ncbi:MAG: alpha/beta fold hydrolase [Nitrosomonadales bacterium]|nr:alpha/beta fold hydrolase [Nitrosomonadales bacterium]